MFEIGNTLHDARARLGLELEDVARATQISARILAALEEERFERLPGDFYARSYLRTYADFLGLESGRFLDEYGERFPEQQPLPLQRGRRRRFAQLHKRALAISVVSAAALGLFLAFGSRTAHRPQLFTVAQAPQTLARKEHEARTAAPRPSIRRPAAPALAIVASRGDCWLLVRAGSASGPTLYQATLQQGRSVIFRRRFLWVRLGAPANVDLRVQGLLVPGLSTLTPTNLLVSPKGARSRAARHVAGWHPPANPPHAPAIRLRIGNPGLRTATGEHARGG
jgi:transcriptional regulator with XRE-family HTH domain